MLCTVNLLDCMFKLIMIIHMYHIIKWQFLVACQTHQSMWIETKDYPSKIVKKEQRITKPNRVENNSIGGEEVVQNEKLIL